MADPFNDPDDEFEDDEDDETKENRHLRSQLPSELKQALAKLSRLEEFQDENGKPLSYTEMKRRIARNLANPKFVRLALKRYADDEGEELRDLRFLARYDRDLRSMVNKMEDGLGRKITDWRRADRAIGLMERRAHWWLFPFRVWKFLQRKWKLFCWKYL